MSILKQADAKVYPRVIAHRHQSFWNATKDHVLGSDAEILTDLGKQRTKNKDIWRAAKAIANTAVSRAPPAMAGHMGEMIGKLDESRGILDVDAFGKKLSAYVPQAQEPFEPEAKRALYDSMVKVFNRHGDAMRKLNPLRIEDIEKWIVQLSPNRNSGNPDYTPVSKEQAVSDYWPVMRDTIIDIVKNGNMDAKLPPYTDNVYAGFHRSPDRPIHGAGIFDKLIGAYLNYHLVQALGYDSPIAWNNLEDMFSEIAVELSSAESTIHDDFLGYDGHFGMELNQLIYDTFLDSSFCDHSKELRNAFEWFCRRLTATDTLLQFSPSHAMLMRASLFSGTPVTQYWGCLFHEAFYGVLEEVYSFPVLGKHILSDDGMLVMECDAQTSERLFSSYMEPLAKKLGHEIRELGKKSYIANLNTEVQMHKNVDILTHDMGPFLQYYPQRDPSLTFGNVPRRIYSLFERERDSSDATRMTMLNTYAPSLSKQALGTDKKIMANWVSDLHRSLDVISTVRSRYPRIREMLRWFAKVYPNFWRKFKRLYGAADPELWQERSFMAGGTRQGESPTWVVDHYKGWMDTGVQPKAPL